MHNIAIYEGGKASRMQGVALITTDDGNGGRVTWVPQDDRKTGTLHVSENGTYRAEDEGLHSWSKVTVRLAGAPAGMTVPTLPDPITGAEIPTGELGEIDPVAPAGLEPLDDIEPISIDEAEDILDELDIDATDPDAIDAIADYLGVDPEDLVIVDPDDASTVKEAEPKVEDKGQKAAGTDAETGQPATVTPSGKEGVIIPDELRVITPPNRTTYEEGDTIDYSGISCALYKDGKLLRSVPFSELSFPVTIAEYNGEFPDDWTNDEGINVMHVTVVGHSALVWKRVDGRYKWVDTTTLCTPPVGTFEGAGAAFGSATSDKSGDFYLTEYDGKLFVKGSGNASIYTYQSIAEYHIGWFLRASYTFNASDNFRRYGDILPEFHWNAPVSTVDPRLSGAKPIHAAGQHQPVPVNWSGDGVSLGTTTEILVQKTVIG